MRIVSRLLRYNLLTAILVMAGSQYAFADTGNQHQATVEKQSERVMPFTMDESMHVFSPSVSGGTQTVLVHGGDARQVALVRAHLRKEAAAFARGDFADPASIHGGRMPGLRVMHERASEIRVRYSDVPSGARIAYAARAPAVIAAIHAWFEAQVHDHGSHAMSM